MDPVKAVLWALPRALQVTWPQAKDKLGERESGQVLPHLADNKTGFDNAREVTQ